MADLQGSGVTGFVTQSRFLIAGGAVDSRHRPAQGSTFGMLRRLFRSESSVATGSVAAASRAARGREGSHAGWPRVDPLLLNIFANTSEPGDWLGEGGRASSAELRGLCSDVDFVGASEKQASNGSFRLAESYKGNLSGYGSSCLTFPRSFG